jgi:prepilin-type N-terminal cleavage/methylation domain-containing protein
MRTSGSPSMLRTRSDRGFTLVELMITLVILGVVMVVLSTIIYTAARSKSQTTNNLDSSQLTRVAVDLIARDLRNAGYKADRDNVVLKQPPIAYIDSLQVLLAANLDDTPGTGPDAYNPAGNPKPFPLVGTAWTPPVWYGTGAELIRWSLDANNDGSVTTADINAADGAEARRTQNPNDYVLLRSVYGDSTGGASGDNGGVAERISLLRRPAGAGVPPLFTVYLFGDPNPWNWSNGPIPAGRLEDIERIVIRGVGTSPKPNWRGQYATTEYRTEVMATRNSTNFGEKEFAVDGYVYIDQNPNNVKDAGDPGVPGASLSLKSYSAYTDSTGYYLFRVPAGTYTLRHSPPPGYQNATSPDSFVVTVGPSQTRSFKDTKLLGGHVGIFVYDDQDQDGVFDAGEPPLQGIMATLTPTGEKQYTGSSGSTRLFAPVGAFTVSMTPPAGQVVTSAHPYSNTMVNGGSDSVAFGVSNVPTGTISGRVFTDNNRNGVLDAGESGVQNVWVGASPDGGLTVVNYKYTDANGDYTLIVPSNDPPATQPYYVTVIVPNGFYPTGSTSLGPQLVQPSQNITGKNFGMASFQVITLNASRVLSLGSADLIEKDWNGNDDQWDTKGRQDADIVLGADAGGTDNIAVWFNNYNSSPLFDPNPTYTRNAANSVLAMRLERLDKVVPTSRTDAVTGTRYSAGGNFFVWFAQNSGGNLGYFSATHDRAYATADLGDVQAVLTADVGGGTSPDIIVGTKSPTSGQGHLEVWLNDEATTPSFARDEVYPPQGNLPGNLLGEVTSMALADLDNDGDPDLVVGTKTGNFTGQLIVFENTGRTTGARFRQRFVQTLSDQAVTALAIIDMNGDGLKDIITGSQVSASAGRVEQWQNALGLTFTLKRQVATGIVMSLQAVDLGGLPREDLVVGYRLTDPGYYGGVSVYFTDLGVIPPFGTDPSNGSVTYMVPALTVNNFNYGVQPTVPTPPYLMDLAAGIKTGPTTGALVVFIR